MSTEIYEIIAQGARYWFLFLMALIVWRSYCWYRRDRRQRKKRLRLLPDAGFVGELVVIDGGGVLKDGSALAVPREGTLGFLRTNDICVPVDGVANKHLWFCFDDDEGLMVEPYGRKAVTVDGAPFKSRREPLYMAHGSRLVIGAAELRLRLFAGFETAAGNRAHVRNFTGEGGGAAQPAMTPEQYAAYQQWMRQAMAGQAMQPGADGAPPPAMSRERYEAYRRQWLAQAAGQTVGEIPEQFAYGAPMENDESYDETYDEADHDAPDGREAYAYPHADEADDDASDGDAYRGAVPFGVENSSHVSAANSSHPSEQASDGASFYPPVTDNDDWAYAPNPYEHADEGDGETAELYDDVLPEDDDMTDAAHPPRSAYIGHDDAEDAKKKVWDRYLGRGRKR